MKTETKLSLGVVGFAAAAVAVLAATSSEREEGSVAPAYGAAPPPDTPPPTERDVRDVLMRSDWPRRSDGGALTVAEQTALLNAAISLADRSFTPTQDITPLLLNAWERLLRERAVPMFGAFPESYELKRELGPRIQAMLGAIADARASGNLFWTYDDFRVLYLMMPESNRHRVDDQAEAILGRSL